MIIIIILLLIVMHFTDNSDFWQPLSKQSLMAIADSEMYHCLHNIVHIESKKISNDQELIQSDPISCPETQKRHN